MPQRGIPTPPFDRVFYESLRAKGNTFRLADRFIIPKESGRGFVVHRGQTARIRTIEGPQIADIDFFNADDPREHLWANQTLNREGAHLTTFSRLWSNMPWFRPLMTIIEDTVTNVPTKPGARHHIILGAHCSESFWLLATGAWGHSNCHDQLVSAIAPFGLKPENVHDNLNLFQKTRIDPETSRYISEPSDAKVGDYVEFFAEMNVLVAVSTCPMGSGRFPPAAIMYSPEVSEPLVDQLDLVPGHPDTKSLSVEIYDTGIEPLSFDYHSIPRGKVLVGLAAEVDRK